MAREMVRREMRGTDPQATEAALKAWVAIEGRRAIKLIAALVEEGTEGSAAALAALRPFSKTPEVRRLIDKCTMAKAPALRAAALILKGEFKRALKDRSPLVVNAALAAMLARQQGVGVVSRWLTSGTEQRRRHALSLLARHGAAASLVRPLTQLYQSAPALRGLIVEAVRGERFRALLLRAASEKDVDVRQAAVLQLARLPRPPRKALEAALKDTNERVRLTAHVGLVRLGQSRSLLALGSGARSGCGERQVVLEALISRMDRASGRKLLVETLATDSCPELVSLAWRLAETYFDSDISLWRIGLSHPSRRVRVAAARTVLGVGKPASKRRNSGSRRGRK